MSYTRDILASVLTLLVEVWCPHLCIRGCIISTPFPPSADVYHLLFHPPDSSDIASRLIEEPNGKQAMMEGLDHYHRYSSPLLDCYSTVSKTFNADQPLDDLFEEGMSELLGNSILSMLWPLNFNDCLCWYNNSIEKAVCINTVIWAVFVELP